MAMNQLQAIITKRITPNYDVSVVVYNFEIWRTTDENATSGNKDPVESIRREVRNEGDFYSSTLLCW